MPEGRLLKIDDFHRTGGEWKNQFRPQTLTTSVIDSREVVPGSVFFAFRGEKTDGHQFIPKAIESGAAIVVYSDPASDRQFLGSDCLGIRTDQVLNYLQDLAARVVRRSKIPVIAITGSNGKTTTKDLVSAVLSSKFKVHRNYKNLNNHLGVPLTILGLNAEHEILVLEMGMNHAGEIARLCEIADPTHGLITNIGTAHIENLGTQEGIARAKGELFVHLTNRKGFAFINADDPFLLKLMAGRTAQSLFFGINNKEASVRARDLVLTPENTWSFSWVDQKSRKSGQVNLQIPGRHMVMNALAAVAVGIKFGIRPEDISSSLNGAAAQDKRMQLVRVGDRQLLIDCYNANPDSMKAGLQSFQELMAPGRKIVVLGDMYELGHLSDHLHDEVGSFLKTLAFDGVITVGKQSARIGAMLKKYPASLGVHHFETREQVMGWLESTLKPGDAVYLKASRGMKLEQISDFLIETYTAGAN
ncbi:MAG: UDP-N-acetylmuramoyl-tripeptide--D-alanyl-D-alanine ligase [Bacteroidetes bacterium]|nr:UDP-N-acetylmuramoyl-tripeptide--D-alanyl-D-alanine ligase [Bacteroidota bacterium]